MGKKHRRINIRGKNPQELDGEKNPQIPPPLFIYPFKEKGAERFSP